MTGTLLTQERILLAALLQMAHTGRRNLYITLGQPQSHDCCWQSGELLDMCCVDWMFPMSREMPRYDRPRPQTWNPEPQVLFRATFYLDCKVNAMFPRNKTLCIMYIGRLRSGFREKDPRPMALNLVTCCLPWLLLLQPCATDILFLVGA